jgi:hypothetical protein
MKSMGISGDRWEGRTTDSWRIDSATSDDLDRALRRLDAELYTLVTVDGDGEAHLCVGGGAGRYVVYATFDNEEYWNLMSDVPASGIVMLTTGGQVGDFPAAQIVSLDQALRAADAFLHGQHLDPAQTWRQ